MLAGVSIVPLMDGLAKYLAGYYPVTQVVWGRFFFRFMFKVHVEVQPDEGQVVG